MQCTSLVSHIVILDGKWKPHKLTTMWHILLLHINLDGIHEQGEKWKPPKLTDLMSEKPFTFCNLYGIHKAPNT